MPGSRADDRREDQLVALLAGRYRLPVTRLDPAPRGWTGETYAATSGPARYFVKVYPRERLPPTAAPALAHLAALHRAGLSEVGRPVPAADGALHAWLGDDLVVVFEYLDAPRIVPFPFGGEEIGDLLARLHEHPPRDAGSVVHETFEPPDGEALWSTLGRACREPAGSDAPRTGLAQYLEQQAAFLASAWAALEAITRSCRAASFDLRLTHGDWPFNLLRGADGALHLVDWDELLLAPAERDTWFAAADPDFWRAYRARRAAHRENELATAYYVHRRYFEDLLGCVQVILGELGDGTPERRARALSGLGNPWFTGWAARIHA